MTENTDETIDMATEFVSSDENISDQSDQIELQCPDLSRMTSMPNIFKYSKPRPAAMMKYSLHRKQKPIKIMKQSPYKNNGKSQKFGKIIVMPTWNK